RRPNGHDFAAEHMLSLNRGRCIKEGIDSHVRPCLRCENVYMHLYWRIYSQCQGKPLDALIATAAAGDECDFAVDLTHGPPPLFFKPIRALTIAVYARMYAHMHVCQGQDSDDVSQLSI